MPWNYLQSESWPAAGHPSTDAPGYGTVTFLLTDGTNLPELRDLVEYLSGLK
jgi:hypothetical protein